MTVGPSPLKVLVGTAMVTVLATVGACILILFTACLGNPWPLLHARWIVVCTAAAFAGFSGFAVLGALVWARPRVEIGPDGFVTQGFLGRRPRRWEDVDGDFAAVRSGWQRVVAYRITAAARARAGPRPSNSPKGYDEAILFCTELSIGARELADLLNRWKRDSPAAAPMANPSIPPLRP
jgi:hypothetical protein